MKHKTMRILIIEDQEKLAKLVKKALESEGYAADCVMDGEAAEKRIELHHSDYDLILLDLMLPKKGGDEICRNVRKMGIKTPILVLTAKSEISDKINLLDIGADDYMIKPFSFQELSARIRAILRRPNNSLPNKLKINDLTLDPATRRVFRHGREVKLTLKEFALLEYFMRNPNVAVNREQILSNLWDFDFNSFSNVVDVHINHLRKKLKLNNNHNGGQGTTALETVPGVGYRLKAQV